MKFGVRIPSLKRRISARTSVKRIVRHNLGVKMPKGGGLITNPKKAAYNRIYNRTSVNADRIINKAKATSSDDNGILAGCTIIFPLVFGGLVLLITGKVGATLLCAFIGLIIGLIVGVKASLDADKQVQIAALSDAIDGHLEKVASGKTHATREKNCVVAIDLIESLREIMPKPEDKAEAAEILLHTKARHKTLSVADFISKADRAEFKGHKKRALNYYLDALFECHNSKITDRDMVIAKFENDQTNEQITTSWIEAKAKALGWKNESKF